MAIFSILIFIVSIALYGSSKPTENKISRLLFARLASLVFILCAFLTYNVLYIDGIGSGIGLFSGYFTATPISLGTMIFLFLVSSGILFPFFSKALSNTQYSNISGNVPVVAEYSLLLIFSAAGGALLLSSSDLISMYLGIELQSFALYILATLYNDNKEATASGLKYFLLGGLSSCFILFGSALIYASTGLTNLDSISALLHSMSDLGWSVHSEDNKVLDISSLITSPILGVLFIFFGFLFKIAAAPFHNWAPDVYDGTPTVVTTWLTIMPKISIIIFLLNIVTSLPSSTLDSEISLLQNLLLASTFLSFILGSIVGLAQFKIKRLLAYSTISHVGFMLLLIAISLSSNGGSDAASLPTESLLFYLFQYTLTNLNVFLILLSFGYLIKSEKSYALAYSTSGVNDTSLQEENIVSSNFSSLTAFGSLGTGSEKDIRYVEELKGQFNENPVLSLSLSLCLFSMAGVPPLIGFFGKMNILSVAINNGFYFMAITAVIISVISAVYYLTIIKTMYFGTGTSSLVFTPYSLSEGDKGNVTNSVNNDVPTISNIHAGLISLITLSLVFFMLNPSFILNSALLLALTVYPV